MPFSLEEIPFISVVNDALIVINLAENMRLAASIGAESGRDGRRRDFATAERLQVVIAGITQSIRRKRQRVVHGTGTAQRESGRKVHSLFKVSCAFVQLERLPVWRVS